MFPLGDSAIIIEFGTEISREINEKVHKAARQLMASPFKGMAEVVPAYTTLTVHYHPLTIPFEEACQEIKKRLTNMEETVPVKGRMLKIPVCYDREFALDLSFVARTNSLTEAEVIEIHTATKYDVYFLGFAPGFPFLGGMNSRIATPRRSSPRLQIPKGSVGIAGGQTGIYPLETPGGWQIIGRTPIPLFSIDKNPPTLIQSSDQVQFVQISREEFDYISKEGETSWGFES